MREDMFKVIVERPRWGHDMKRRRSRHAGLNDLPLKIGMKRHAAMTQYGTKDLNENLVPLERYLRRQVGRPWRLVYKEICAGLDSGSTVKQHVRDHLDDFVIRRVTIGRDGTPEAPHAGWSSRWGEPWIARFYVDPRNGLLKEIEDVSRKRSFRPDRSSVDRPDQEAVKLSDMRELRRLDGIWYDVKFACRLDAAPDERAFDMLERHAVSPSARHAVAKRQLSKNELNKYRLSNTWPQ